MEKIKALLCLLLSINLLVAQDVQKRYPDSLFSTYYHQRNTLFNTLPKKTGEILFVGNSITDGGEWSELFNDLNVKNRGISGDVTVGVINRIESLLSSKPSKIFLMIGVNDLAAGIATDSVAKNIFKLVTMIKSGSPSTKIFVQSILPVNPDFNKFNKHVTKASEIRKVNMVLDQNQVSKGYSFINLHASFVDEKGNLSKRFTNDGLHLTSGAYQFWKHLLWGHVYDLSSKPALIPSPTNVVWKNGYFELFKCASIINTDPDFENEAAVLKEHLSEMGIQVDVLKKAASNKPTIVFKKVLSRLGEISKESYKLNVTENRIEIHASGAHGIFNGIQTLLQLCRDNSVVDACTIDDQPAFALRGYMFDVGRNYQSLDLIKQQIDVMAAYKLNTYHMHLTEDLAWRIQSHIYPQLNASANMGRNVGQFYTYKELNEIARYCAERHIEFIPEIDMPGHSAAFKKAMGVDMQTEEGKGYLKKILKEFVAEVNTSYIHIGGDEVEYRDKSFLEEISNLLAGAGKKIIAWDPGGKVPVGTIHQLWNGNKKQWPDEPCIDSRHLYLNHLDPLEGVSATFNHYILDAEKGDSIRLGAILCNWPDRRLANETDALTMSATYPTMLAFAERCWKGGGYHQFNSDIGRPGEKGFEAFQAFESRLMDHKKGYFKQLPFPYARQASVSWSLIGPYANQGDVFKSFMPESKTYLDTINLTTKKQVYGGTIWLRHFWDPMIGSHLKNQDDSATWYATRKIFSETTGIKNFWIGFNNISRSNIVPTPKHGEWDNKGSRVWLNGESVQPPVWKYAGRKPNMEEPLFDEGYEYRPPTKLLLKKGWNTILIKAPVSSFKGYWYDPVKWMFTMVMVDE